MTTAELEPGWHAPSNEGVPGTGADAFFFDSDTLPYLTNEEHALQLPPEQREEFLDAVGRDMTSTVILMSPTLSVVRVRVAPGAKVHPHRHGTDQITYILSGSLHYGKRSTSAGQGYFSPNKKYAWTAGPEGAEWIEVHAGQPLPYKLD